MKLNEGGLVLTLLTKALSSKRREVFLSMLGSCCTTLDANLFGDMPRRPLVILERIYNSTQRPWSFLRYSHAVYEGRIYWYMVFDRSNKKLVKEEDYHNSACGESICQLLTLFKASLLFK